MPSPETAMMSAAGFIRSMSRKVMSVDDVGGQPLRGGRESQKSRMLTVSLEMGDVIYGLANLGMAMNKPALSALMAQGDDWVAAIRDHTPHGPTSEDDAGRHSRQPRRLPAGLKAAARLSSVPADSYSHRIWKNEGLFAIKEARRAGGYGPHEADDKVVLDKAAQLIQRGYSGAPANENFQWGGTEQGSLWSSIGVKGHTSMHAGHIQMEAYSDNYYAGYVNDGFHHGLMPMLRRQSHSGGLMKFKFKPYISISRERLGDYPIWRTMNKIDSSVEGGQPLFEAFAWDDESEMLTPDAGGKVTFAVRESKPWQEGAHMFEKGTAQFLTRATGKFRKDMEAVFHKAWDNGLVWHDIDRQFRVRAGHTGGNHPGTFAGGTPGA